ncbi:MAG: hypothetical protein Q9197_003737 [Variospora fuerteventurae]
MSISPYKQLETAQQTLNTDQQALRKREERLAADGRNLTEERTELEKHQEIVKANNNGVATFKRNRTQQIQEHQLHEESVAADETLYEVRVALLEERERQSKATLSDLLAHKRNIKALDESVKKRQREAADQLQKAQQSEKATKENQAEFRKLLDQWEQKAIESFEAPCQRLQEETRRQGQVHQATTAGQAKDLAERYGDSQNHLNQQEQVQQDTASQYVLSVSATVRELIQHMNNTEDARTNRREEEIDWLEGLFSEVHADFAALVTLITHTGETLTRTVQDTAKQQQQALRNTTTNVVEEARQALSQHSDNSGELPQQVLEKTIEDTADQTSQELELIMRKRSKGHSHDSRTTPVSSKGQIRSTK